MESEQPLTAERLINRAASVKSARASLARIMQFSRWSKAERSDHGRVCLWLAIVREWIALAALSPDEECAVTMALRLDAAIVAAAESLN